MSIASCDQNVIIDHEDTMLFIRVQTSLAAIVCKHIQAKFEVIIGQFKIEKKYSRLSK